MRVSRSPAATRAAAADSSTSGLVVTRARSHPISADRTSAATRTAMTSAWRPPTCGRSTLSTRSACPCPIDATVISRLPTAREAAAAGCCASAAATWAAASDGKVDAITCRPASSVTCALEAAAIRDTALRSSGTATAACPSVAPVVDRMSTESAIAATLVTGRSDRLHDPRSCGRSRPPTGRLPERPVMAPDFEVTTAYAASFRPTTSAVARSADVLTASRPSTSAVIRASVHTSCTRASAPARDAASRFCAALSSAWGTPRPTTMAATASGTITTSRKARDSRRRKVTVSSFLLRTCGRVRCSHAMEAKRLLRSRLLAARAARTAEEVTAAGAALAEHASLAWSDAGTVAAYAATGTEPPTRPSLDRLRALGVTVLVPVVVDTGLRWAPYEGWERLEPGPFGLLQPTSPLLPVDVLRHVDVVAAPALAVDRQGHRLGRGGGYFDRALADVAPSSAVAVVFDDELVDEVPVEEHDRDVGAVLTPSGLRRLPAG